MSHTIQDTLAAIVPVDRSLVAEIQAHLDDLTKPRGSLGRLETAALRYGLARGTAKLVLEKKRIVCFAGDHGVADEGVSAYPKEVTPQMVMNMLGGGAAINVLARHVGADLVVVDMGVDDPLADAEGLCRRKVRRGTRNMAKGPAMSIEEATAALQAGIDLAADAERDGVSLLGTGDMGIANTTPSAALFAVYLDCPVDDITGHGTGIDDEALQHKIAVIKKAIKVNQSRLGDPLNVLAALGGLEIAGIAGLILGAAARHIPVVVDGFISSAAALAACRLSEPVKDYLFFSHVSNERGHAHVLEHFEVEPLLDLGLRLGEGTGAALAMSLIEAAVKICNEMATFSSAGVSDKE